MNVVTSAGIMLYRRNDGGEIEVLLAHPGGPYTKNKDQHCWSIVKGETDGEDVLSAALREFNEETGHDLPEHAALIDLSDVMQSRRKRVFCYAAEYNLNVKDIICNECEIEFPPKSGRIITIPENDRYEWYDIETAREKINSGQEPFLDRLLEELGKNFR